MSDDSILLTLAVNYTDNYGITHSTTKNVNCIPYDPNAIDFLEIRGVEDTDPDVFLEPTKHYEYECYATTLGGVRFKVNPVWLVENGSLYISAFGSIDVPLNIYAAFTTKVVASYPYNNIYTKADLQVYVIPAMPKPVALHIRGYGIDDPNDYLVENRSYSYYAEIEWDTADRTVSPARWVSTVFPIGVDTGILKTGIVDKDESIIIHARVSFDGLSRAENIGYNPFPADPVLDYPILTADATVLLKSRRSLLSVVSLTIEGPSFLQVPNYARYYSFVNKTDEKKYAVESNWVVYELGTTVVLNHMTLTKVDDEDSNTHYVEIVVNNDQASYATALANPIVELEANYINTEDGSVYKSRKLVYVIIDATVYEKRILSCEISGPSSVSAHRRQSYETIVRYSDGTNQVVKSLWDLETPKQEDNYVVAYLTPQHNEAFLTTRTVHGDTIVKIKAQHYLCRMEKDVVIVDDYESIIDTATCSYIEGPYYICIGEYASYSLMIHWNGDQHPSRESAEWELNEAGYKYAWVDGEGNLTALDTNPTPVTVMEDGTPYVDVMLTARYTCDSTGEIVRSYPVRIAWCAKDGSDIRLPIYTPCSGLSGVLQYVQIMGPSSIEELTSSQYILLGYYLADDGTMFSQPVVADFWELESGDYVYADIDTKGVLTGKGVNNNQSVKINACYTDTSLAQTFCDDHPVVILDRFTVLPQSVEILGVTKMTEGTEEVFRLRVNFNDGTSTVLSGSVNVNWSITTPATTPSYLTTVQSNAQYKITAATLPVGVTNASITMTAIYTTDTGVELSDTHSVLIEKALSSLRVVWGYGPFGGNNETFVNTYLTTPFAQVSGQTMNIVPQIDKYVYFCCPASLSPVGFNTTNLSQGGMNGATWPEGEPGFDYGPLTITRSDGNTWHLYRSDYIPKAPYSMVVNYND